MTDQPPPGSYPPPPPPGGGYNPRPQPGSYPPPQQGGYSPQQQGGYSPPQQGGYPPPQQGGYPPPQQGGYGPAHQQGGGYPPPGGGQYPPSQAGGFPGNAVGVLPQDAYTSWVHRAGAWFIDAIPLIVVLGIGQIILLVTGDTSCVDYDTGYGGYCSSTPSGIGLVIAFLAWLASLAYAIWNWGYRQGTTGSSIGKSILKFKVVSEKTGQPLGFGMSIVRQLAHVVDSAICYIGYLFPLWDAKRQTLADKIMSTVCLPLTPAGPGGGRHEQ